MSGRTFAARRTAAALAIAGAGALLAGCLAPGTPSGWSSYTIKAGAHSAEVAHPADDPGPKAGWYPDGGARRTYQLTLTPTAEYVITNPAQPNDQLDWNKLPGFSDCGDFDLSQNGAMFGWRWRPDLSPARLELAAYANNDGTHLWSSQPLVTLSAADLAAKDPLTYDIRIDGNRYLFDISGTVAGRAVDVSDELPRACPTNPTSTGKWYAGFYFGGTSVSPQEIYAYVLEAG
ncbi:MAG: hypothetical protein KDA98_11775 [Acidimicrobiales bacterium]|nr:hypothetical protein [Acidimicrobiales bacterium]